MKTSKRIPPLDGLRAIMIFLVSWYHIWQQSWLPPYIGRVSLDFLVRSGYVWVDGTVLMSAFLLYLPYAEASARGLPPPDARDFYYRRARRILPSYYFIIALTFLAVCLPWNLYVGNGPWMVKDLATHLSFTFPFFYDTYVATPLGAASWTLAVEVQAYALFPWVARSLMKKPLKTGAVLLLLCFGFRAWCLWGLNDYTMVVNQLINFLDVYVIGIAGAAGYTFLAGRIKTLGRRQRLWTEIGATLLFFGAVYGLIALLRFQAGSNGYAEIQRRQMIYRPLYALLFLSLMAGGIFGLRPLRFLLGNRVARFFSAISMNYYLIHQVIIVHMKRLHFPASRSESPNTMGEQPWQNQYTALAFLLSFAFAVLITYAVEKPIGRLMDRQRAKSLPEGG